MTLVVAVVGVIVATATIGSSNNSFVYSNKFL